MSPLGPMGDPSFVNREVRSHVDELDWEAANKELRYQARAAREAAGTVSRGSALRARFAGLARRITTSAIDIGRRAAHRPIAQAPAAGARRDGVLLEP